MSERPRLGELLVAAGVIDEAQCERALHEQRRTGRRLGATLLEMDALSEETLTRTLARQLSLPVAWLRGKRIRSEILDLVPRELIEKHHCLPVHRKDGDEPTLLLAMEDPSDVAAIDEVARHAGLAIQPVLAAPSELDDAIRRHAPVDPGDSLACAEFMKEDPSHAPELLALQTAASDAGRRPQAALPPFEFAGERDPAPSQAVAMPSPAPSPSPSPSANGLVLRALTQLLVEKGVITRAELIGRLRKLGGSASDGDDEG